MCCAWKYLQTENCPCPNQAAATWPISPAEAASWGWGGGATGDLVECGWVARCGVSLNDQLIRGQQNWSRVALLTSDELLRLRSLQWGRSITFEPRTFRGRLESYQGTIVVQFSVFRCLLLMSSLFSPHLKPYVRVRKIRNTLLITEREIVVLQPLLRRAAKRSRRNKCVVWDVHIEHLLKQLYYFIISELAHLRWLDLIDSC